MFSPGDGTYPGKDAWEDLNVNPNLHTAPSEDYLALACIELQLPICYRPGIMGLSAVPRVMQKK